MHHFHRDEKFYSKVQDLHKLVDDKYYTESLTPRERNRIRNNKLKSSISKELPKTKHFIDILKNQKSSLNDIKISGLEDELKKDPMYQANKGFTVVNGNDIELIKNSPPEGMKFRPYQRKGDNDWRPQQ